MISRLLAILLVLLGVVALCRLPVALYPQLVPPTVQVTAHYPGASAATVAKVVALPIEQQVNAVPDMLYMQSESGADGTYTLTVTFARGTDVDVAQTLVGRRVANALATLPSTVQAQGVSVQPKSTDVLMFVALSSPVKGSDELYTGLAGELARLPGVVAQAYGEGFALNGQPAVGIAISQVPGANAVAVADAVRQKMAELARAFPPGLTYSVPFDTTLYTRAAINQVYWNLLEAVILVLAVILVFLQDWRASMVAGIGIGVTAIGAFAAIAAIGFSINLATLFAIILSIPLSVEAFERSGEEPYGPMIGTTMIVLAVFTPAAFLPGLPGKLFTSFTMMMVAIVLISAIIAATLKRPAERHNFLVRRGNAGFHVLAQNYLLLARRMLARSGSVVSAALILGAFAIWGLVQIPRGLLPAEDQGYVLLATQLPQGAALDRTRTVLAQIEAMVRTLPDVDRVVTIAGISAGDGNATLANAGISYVVLKDGRQRDGLRAIIAQLAATAQSVGDGNTSLIVPPAIQGIGASDGFTMQVELRDGSLDYPKLAAVTSRVVAHAATQSGLALLSGGVVPSALIGRYNLYPSSPVRGMAARGFSSGEAMRLMEQVAAATVPPGIGYDFTAMSYQDDAAGGWIYTAFAVAVLLVYLVLAVHYRNFLAPLAVLAALPLALLGPVAALDANGLDNDLGAQIGLFLLIALASRNAMRIVTVARRRRAAGVAINEAALDAARLCLRPMLMTSLVSILGVMPLLSAHGAGAAWRFSIGVTVFSGLIASTCLTMLFVPSFFVVTQKLAERSGRVARGLAHEEALEPVVSAAPARRAGT
jgi:multidrug efflux pump subunit AcrB